MSNLNFTVDYRRFRIRDINSAEYRHLWLLLFWPVFTLRYFLIENLNPADSYTVIHCQLDDVIPFCEGFFIFYVLWYVLIFLMHLYTLLYDIDAFKRYSKFLIISITISTTIFLVFPSCQELRPTEFPRDNLLTRLVAKLYAMDTNTNVFPSEHVIGAIAVFTAAINTERLRGHGKTLCFAVLTALAGISTVFLKQHSVLDVLAALPVCAVAYWFAYKRKRRNRT